MFPVQTNIAAAQVFGSPLNPSFSEETTTLSKPLTHVFQDSLSKIVKAPEAPITSRTWQALGSYTAGHLDLSGSSITDTELAKMIGDFSKEHRLLSLNLKDCSHITDEGLAALKGLPLHELNLKNCSLITNAGLIHLVDLPLTDLNLALCLNISDKGLAHLAHLPLRELDLSVCEVTDEGLFHLRNLLIIRLRISNNPYITYKGLAHLHKLPLKELDLSECYNLTDDCLAHLAHLSITELNLCLCKNITLDGALMYLPALPLTSLNLTGCTMENPAEVTRYLLTRHSLDQTKIFGKETTLKKTFPHSDLHELIAFYAL